MIALFMGLLNCLSAFFRSRYSLDIEILALHQQLGVLKRKSSRPRLRIHDRVFWILLRRFWPAWSKVLIIVKPETVVRLASSRLSSRLAASIAGKDPWQAKLNGEVRDLIRRMAFENSSWGAPRIHGELLKLGFDVSERSVSRYLRRISPASNAGKL